MHLARTLREGRRQRGDGQHVLWITLAGVLVRHDTIRASYLLSLYLQYLSTVCDTPRCKQAGCLYTLRANVPSGKSKLLLLYNVVAGGPSEIPCTFSLRQRVTVTLYNRGTAQIP